jgi:hypothetical protein
MGCLDDKPLPSPENNDSLSVHESDTGDDETVDVLDLHAERQAEAEGYTPLADLATNGSGTMFMAYPPADEQDEPQESGGGIFFADTTAFPANYQSVQFGSGSDDDDKQVSDIEEKEKDEVRDFRTLADEALKSLETDYRRVVDGGESKVLNETKDATSQRACGEYRVCLDDADFDPYRSLAASSIPATPVESPTKELPDIDTDAVRKAVQAIQRKAPKFTSNLDKWQQENIEILAPREHPIIPPAPLAAFRKRSQKAISATANLSRSATIADSLDRLFLLKSQERLVLHVIGADHVECESEEKVRSFFGPLVRWIGAFDKSPAHIQILLIGPNVPTDAATLPPIDLMPISKLKKTSRLVSAIATCHVAPYHEWLGRKVDEGPDGAMDNPDLVIAFNAGIWGYEEWRPTLRALCESPLSALFVVTSYTILEGEDDAEVIEAVISECNTASCTSLASNMTRKNQCIWPIDASPFGSKQRRQTETAVAGREYRENAAWQAWRLGWT